MALTIQERINSSPNAQAVKYNYSFEAKLIQSDDATKELYCQLCNYIMSFKGVKYRLSWRACTFNKGRQVVAKLAFRGKTLALQLPLDYAQLPELKFKVKDMSDKKSMEKTPVEHRVKSQRAVVNGTKLVDLVAEQLDLQPIEPKLVLTLAHLPYEETETLLARELVKRVRTKDKGKDQVEHVAHHHEVTAEQAHTEISDNLAEHMVIFAKDRVLISGPKDIVNVDTLSQNFNNGDVVTMEVLKQKGLIPQNAQAVKVLARGMLDKILVVYAHDFSDDAIKMIVICGGKVIHV